MDTTIPKYKFVAISLGQLTALLIVAGLISEAIKIFNATQTVFAVMLILSIAVMIGGYLIAKLDDRIVTSIIGVWICGIGLGLFSGANCHLLGNTDWSLVLISVSLFPLTLLVIDFFSPGTIGNDPFHAIIGILITLIYSWFLLGLRTPSVWELAAYFYFFGAILFDYVLASRGESTLNNAIDLACVFLFDPFVLVSNMFSKKGA